MQPQMDAVQIGEQERRAPYLLLGIQYAIISSNGIESSKFDAVFFSP